MRVSEVMTVNPTCCTPSDSARTAATIMRDLNIGIVPIVEDGTNRKLVGVVTDRDLCIGLMCGESTRNTGERRPSDIPIEECMTATVISCKPEDNLQKALDLMRKNQIRRILVTDDRDGVQGIISMADLMLRAEVTPRETSLTLKSISQPTEESAEAAESGRSTWS